MQITRLNLHNFRNYVDLSVSPNPGMNILLGKNAQGKTSILEAIYVGATTRSWKAGKEAEMIRWDADQARISMEVVREAQNDIEIEAHFSRTEKKHISVNTVRQMKVADLIGQVKVLLIEPEDGEIVRGEPSARRRFLNLEISQVQPMYCHLLGSYKKVLEQRNRLMKDIQKTGRGTEVLDILNEQLVNYGSKILERRLHFVQQLNDLSRVIHAQITDTAEVLEIKYVSSTNLEGATTSDEIAQRFRDHLRQVREYEFRRGVTLAGPQRDDLHFLVNGVDARTYGSHGQQRTIALSLRLAELDVMEESAKEPPIVLLDDVMTDLDEERRGHVFEMTYGRCQTFVTAPSDRAFGQEFLSGSRIYRVSKGQVTAT